MKLERRVALYDIHPLGSARILSLLRCSREHIRCPGPAIWTTCPTMCWAGGKMSAFTSALSAASSATSGWTMLVFPALAFSLGLIHMWTGMNIVLGVWLVWTVMGRRLRRYTIATDDSLTCRSSMKSVSWTTLGCFARWLQPITVFFIVFYVSSGLISGAKLLGIVSAFLTRSTTIGESSSLLLPLAAS